MKVSEVMNRQVFVVSVESTVQEASRLMAENRIGGLVVLRGTKVAGILTERDLVNKVLARGRSSKIKVSEIMTKEVVMVSPDTDIEDAVDVMLERGIKRLPILQGSKIVGIITATDVCSAQPKALEKLSELFMLPKKNIVAG